MFEVHRRSGVVHWIAGCPIRRQGRDASFVDRRELGRVSATQLSDCQWCTARQRELDRLRGDAA